jgi:hypothetical protein
MVVSCQSRLLLTSQLLLLLAVSSGQADTDSSSAKEPLFSTPAVVTTTPDYGTAPPFDSGEPQGPSLGFILGVVTIIVTIFYIIGKQASTLISVCYITAFKVRVGAILITVLAPHLYCKC